MYDVGIIDYGMGNIRSVQKGLEKVGVRAELCSDPARLDSYRGLVLPGVGAFGDAMATLRDRGLVEPVLGQIRSGKPFLGICLGMQLLFERSEEHGDFGGLGVIPGTVRRLPDTVKVPHMGWNVLRQVGRQTLFDGIDEGARFYFVHSYYCDPADDSWAIGSTSYGLEFTCAVGRDNVWGLQFHPEKSSLLGLKMLRNFGGMVAA
ncbi:MAG: imidazole glycerol phosphate synthase subunit HisH [Actinobacteria bacterium]|nr:imidazole glycerol phosphate synthase subunit HisH [Actinomycetota bacterium]MBU1944656.1 imidazole glycerol phosphate synthase subunit HisH [Actinomycetota bacterium]MBU2689204.1 imidazole glycerol phosphate synthase subunit HisH [Actinomycetota bacterium]